MLAAARTGSRTILPRTPGSRARAAALAVTAVEGRAELAELVDLPRTLYAGDPFWVPPLRREELRFFSPKNPHLRSNATRLFLARRHGKAVGRIAATVHGRHNAIHQEKTGFFGFFDCDGDPETAAALLAAARGFLRAEGMEVMRGPLNLTTNHTCGLLVEGFDGPPLLDMPYNPAEYAGLLEAEGLAKAKDLLAYWIEPETALGETSALAKAAREAPPGYRVRDMQLSGRGFRQDMDLFYDLYHHAWRDNWGFVPLDRDEYGFLVERLRPALAPGLSHVAEVDGKPAGMFIGVPDFNQVLAVLGGRLTPAGLCRAWLRQRRIDAARYLLTGIYDAYRGTPVAALLLHRSLAGARARGCRGVEVSWVLEDNEPANRFFTKHGFRAYRRYRIYEGPLGGAA